MLVDLRMGKVETEYQRVKLARSFPKRDRRNSGTPADFASRLRLNRFINPAWNRRTTASS